MCPWDLVYSAQQAYEVGTPVTPFHEGGPGRGDAELLNSTAGVRRRATLPATLQQQRIPEENHHGT